MEIVGWIGTILVVIAYIPQIRHLYVEKCAWGISIPTWYIWLVASVLLLIYAVFGNRSIFVVVQVVNLLAIVVTIILARKSRNICPYHLAKRSKGSAM